MKHSKRFLLTMSILLMIFFAGVISALWASFLLAPNQTDNGLLNVGSAHCVDTQVDFDMNSNLALVPIGPDAAYNSVAGARQFAVVEICLTWLEEDTSLASGLKGWFEITYDDLVLEPSNDSLTQLSLVGGIKSEYQIEAQNSIKIAFLHTDPTDYLIGLQTQTLVDENIVNNVDYVTQEYIDSAISQYELDNRGIELMLGDPNGTKVYILVWITENTIDTFWYIYQASFHFEVLVYLNKNEGVNEHILDWLDE